MIYCKRCVIPETRPQITIGPNGVCNACKNHDAKNLIDWSRREIEFKKIVEEAKSRSKNYDCVIPVSGGKDSTWQVIKCLNLGLKVLAVTWRTPGRTRIGQANLDNLIGLGVDHIDYTINPEVERKFTYKTLLKTGSSGVPMHMALFSIPVQIAVKFDIPLVVWGESPFMEYGGADSIKDINTLDNAWLKRHGILQGTSCEDWIDQDITRKDLAAYFFPSDHEMKQKKIVSVFLGYYFKWDPEETYRQASKHGFKKNASGPRLGYYDYADIDCDFISIHHYFKWLKFGFTRLFDNLSLEIRNGRLSRDEAIQKIRQIGRQRPDRDIERFCRFLRITEEHFCEIEDKFRNHNIWIFENNVWKIPGFLINDWRWDKRRICEVYS